MEIIVKRRVLMYYYILIFCIKFFPLENFDEVFKNTNFTIRIKDSPSSYNLIGCLRFLNGQIKSFGNGTFYLIINPGYFLKDNSVDVYFSRTIVTNLLDENRKSLKLSFPERYKINLSFEELNEIYSSNRPQIDKYIKTATVCPSVCQAIIIDNLNVRDEPSLSGNKIGRLEKRTEVTLYEESKNIDEIDGEKNPWYKVKLDDNTYGWVYGGYVRIFFEDPNLGYSDKELILKSIE